MATDNQPKSILITRNYLLDTISLLLPGVAKKEVFEQADKIGLKAGWLFSYDDYISVSHRFPELVDIEGAIDGHLLHDFLISIPDRKITLDVSDNLLNVYSDNGRARASLKLAPLWLTAPEIEDGQEWLKLPIGFNENLQTVATICARDLSRPALTCVSMSREWMEGSDGYQCLRVFCEGLPEMLLPCDSALKIASYDITHVSAGKEWAHFQTTSGTIVSARNANHHRYPRLDQVYAITGSTFKLPDKLLSVLGRAKVFAKAGHRIDEMVWVEFRPHRIRVGAKTEAGQLVQTIRWDRQDISQVFSTNINFLTKALRQGANCVLGHSAIKFVGDGWQHIVALRDTINE